MTRVLGRIREWLAGPGHRATIDTAKAAPPPSPLAPVDLTSTAEVAGVMEIAARIGDILLSSGTSNTDTKAQIRAVTSAYGLVWCHVDITMNNIMMSASTGVNRSEPVSIFRVVRRLTVDFSQLADVDRLIRSIQAGATPPEVAERILNDLEARPPSYGAKTATLGWGLMGGALAIMLGGTPLVGIISFLTSTLIMGVNHKLAQHSLPPFFHNVIGGLIATLPAAAAFAAATRFGLDFRPSQIIASGIIVLLAGLTLVQSLEDGITGSPVTASAHFFETLLSTGAIIAGVGMGIQIVSVIGIALPPMEAVAPPNFSSIALRVFAGGLAAVGFAIASYAKWPAVTLAGITGMFGAASQHALMLGVGLGAVISASVSAVFIGLAGGLLARRFAIPPLIIALCGITPMLPGLAFYRGMYGALNEQMVIGFANIATAMATACGLAAGVVLGEWLARRIRRPQRFNPYRVFRRYTRSAFTEARRAAGPVARARRTRRQAPGAKGE
ncbi:threonine/serine exporter ThrE [Corynebacterium otitidis]